MKKKKQEPRESLRTKKLPPKKKEVQKQKPKSAKKLYTLNADGKILGRMATQIAIILRGKDSPTFRPNILSKNIVEVENSSKIIITGRKLEQKKYYRHSGYLGKLKTETLADLMKKDPSEVLRRAVRGMLPKNKLQDQMMKNLKIYNGVKNA